jgi:hypothetical protein
MMEETTLPIDEKWLRALQIVNREGWLSKAGWSISRGVHAFAKPSKAVIRRKTRRAIATSVLARPLIKTVRLQGNMNSTPPLPAGLQSLELSRYCGTLDQLPSSLTSLAVFAWRGAPGIACVVRALEAAPAGLQLLNLNRGEHQEYPEIDELEGVQCPSGVTTLRLQGVGWRMELPSQLYKLSLSSCVIGSDVDLPAKASSIDSSNKVVAAAVTVLSRCTLEYTVQTSWIESSSKTRALRCA